MSFLFSFNFTLLRSPGCFEYTVANVIENGNKDRPNDFHLKMFAVEEKTEIKRVTQSRKSKKMFPCNLVPILCAYFKFFSLSPSPFLLGFPHDLFTILCIENIYNTEHHSLELVVTVGGKKKWNKMSTSWQVYMLMNVCTDPTLTYMPFFYAFLHFLQAFMEFFFWLLRNFYYAVHKHASNDTLLH